MKFEKAPLFTDIAESPAGAVSLWLRAADGNRIRMAVWPSGKKGTILLYPGRTEYIEKYGMSAGEFLRRGFSFATVDWRGQGLSDRQHDDRSLCHVGSFSEFQLDAAAARQALSELAVPQPIFLLAHSMGGCIGLRSLHEGFDFRASAFSGPMWRIYLGRVLRKLALAISKSAVGMGFSKKYVFGTNHRNYIHFAKADKNVLTSDDEMFLFLRRQIESRTELSVGGPSYGWFYAAIKEGQTLMEMKPPPEPALILLGTNERVVDPKAIRILHSRWETSRLVTIQGARHEIMMENYALRQEFFDCVADYFDEHRS